MRRRILKRLIEVIIALVVVGMVMPSYAEEKNAFTKLGRGIVNISTGWIELPKNIESTSREENPFVGLTWGSIKGSGMTAVRTSAGAVETATFIFPSYAKPLLEPEYAF